MELNIKDVGPIAEFQATLVPGITVLRGKNGAGKSTALRAARALVTKDGKSLDKRDGRLTGKVEGLGCTLTIGQRRKHSGEIAVMSIEGKFDLAGLVEPGYEDPLAADRERIKSLIAMSGRKLTPDAFYDCCDGTKDTFEKVMSVKTLETTEPIELAQRVKRDLEEHARKLEEDREKLVRQMTAKAEVFANVSLDEESDAELLQAQLEEAVTAKARAIERRDTWQAACNRAAEAQPRLAMLRNRQGTSVADASKATEEAESAVWLVESRLKELRDQLQAAEQDRQTKLATLEAAQRVLADAKAHEEHVAELEAMIATNIEAPSHDEVLQAEGRVTLLREKIEQGARIREAIRAREEHRKLAEQLEGLNAAAKTCREGAKMTDDILARHLPDCGLKVQDGRLTLETERGETYFADLSHGEKWSLAVQVAQQLGGEEHFLTIDQEAWESLDFTNRSLIAERAKALGARVLTAEADHEADSSGELRAEPYEPETV
jgi:energy-coupling factor transporter ATP-binding protein EcfA2